MKKLSINIDTLNFKKGNGLVNAVIQDGLSGTVLMVGYQNRASIEKTLEQGRVTLWSRSNQRLWTKGEESGNFLEVLSIQQDCDRDALLYIVKAPKATCHTGNFSCFGKDQSFGFLTELAELIENRKINRPKESYLTSLFERGLDRIAQKVGEEAVETVIASKNEDKEDFLNESADLLFHLMVLCVEKDIPFEEVISQLKSRA